MTRIERFPHPLSSMVGVGVGGMGGEQIRKISIFLSGILQKSKMPSVEYRHLEVPYAQIRFSKKQISSQTLLLLMSHSVCPMVCLSSGF